MTSAPTRPTFTERVAASTPAGRDRFIDAVRAGSLLVVVLGHWLMATVVVDHGRLEGGNALTAVPALQPATWLLQVMPLFFIAGGFSNLTVWRSLRRRGEGYPAYLQGRLVRLLRPTLVFVLSWQLLLPIANAAGLAPDRLDLVSLLLGQPLWFLGVYVATTALAPAMLRWHERSATSALVALAVGAVVVDWFRFWRGMENVGYLNLGLVWLFAQQLGFWYAEGRFTTWSRWRLAAVVGGCLALLGVLTTLGPYPVSMVGLPGETSNMTPPTICLLVLAIGQLAGVLLLRDRIARWLTRPRAWAAVVRFGAMAMTVYLWHLSVLVLGYLALVGLGLTLPAAGSGLWWATRPLWLLALATVTLGLATLLAPLERGRTPKRPAVTPAVAPAATPPNHPAAQGIPATTPVGGPREQAPGIPASPWRTWVAGAGAALASFGLLGYVASGLQPAPWGSSILLFVPVDPVQNTLCVLLGLALSTLASRPVHARTRRNPRLGA